MTDKAELQKELEGILEKVRPEEKLLSDATVEIIIDHTSYELPDKSPAEVLDNKYRERYFPIMVYRPIEKYKKKEEKEIIIRHEIVHIRDMVNPAFEYKSDDKERESIKIISNNSKYNDQSILIAIVRKYLWEISIAMRLKKENNLDDFETIDKRRESFLSPDYLRFFTKGVLYKPNYDMDAALKSMEHPVEQLINEIRLTLPGMREIAKSQIDCFEKLALL